MWHLAPCESSIHSPSLPPACSRGALAMTCLCLVGNGGGDPKSAVQSLRITPLNVAPRILTIASVPTQHEEVIGVEHSWLGRRLPFADRVLALRFYVYQEY